MRAISLFTYETFSSRAESFNSVSLTFLHLYVCVSFNARDCFTSMNLVWINGVTIQIFYNFNWIDFSIKFDFIRLHCLLDLGSNFTEPSVNTCLTDTSVGCILDSLKQVIILWVEGDSKCGINNSTIDVCSEIDLTNIIVFQYIFKTTISNNTRFQKRQTSK